MRFLPAIIIFLLLVTTIFPFSIDSYNTHATVLANGDLQVTETMAFTLEKAYNEGFRSIRKEDFGSLDNIVIQSVKVNDASVQYAKQLNGQNAEIVWKKTYEGRNVVELKYLLKNRAQLYDDFAKVCFEHYGANWPVSAAVFQSRMTLPEASRGKAMHFEVYSTKEGSAHIDDLSVVIDMDNIPSGNYIGGCYLYDKSALHTTNVVRGSALQILKDERKAYGSKEILAAEEPGSITCCCFPIALLAAIFAGYYLYKDVRIKKLPENLLPPDKEEPAVVTALVRNELSEADILASSILDMINRGNLDILELENKGETSATVNRERTILFLKKRPDNPKPYEKAILDMLFPAERKEVDLDAMVAEFNAVKTKEEAKKNTVSANIDIFTNEITTILKSKGAYDIRNAAQGKKGGLIMLGFFGLFGLCILATIGGDWFPIYFQDSNYVEIFGTLLSFLLFIPAMIYIIFHSLKPSVPDALREEFSKWDAFARAVKSSRLKEYPPASAVIWGEILVYATALGMADKVKHHMSELDSLTTKRLEKLETVRRSSRTLYTSAWALHNLRTYGNRHGPVSSGRHGGFSSHSSGGWSSGGGGGFSSGSSGGGGFR